MDEEPQRRMRALLEVRNVNLIHNDLSDAAFYFKSRIDEQSSKGKYQASFVEMMAALIMTSFAFEAYLNFVGGQKIKDWKERDPIRSKIKLAFQHLGISHDYSKRPLSTIAALIDLRNTLAHGKPRVDVIREEVEGTHDELTTRLRGFQAEWEKHIEPNFVATAYEDVETLWRLMLTAADIKVIETMSGGSSGITFLKYLEQL